MWDWTSGSDDPLCKTTLNMDFGQQVSCGTHHSPETIGGHMMLHTDTPVVPCAISSDVPGVQHGGLLPASQQQ